MVRQLPMRRFFFVVLCAFAQCVGVDTIRCTANETDDKAAFFERHIRPLLIAKCYECHATTTETNGGLVLDSREGWQKGGDSGPAIEPGDPAKSRFMRAIEYRDPKLQMPPEEPLTANEVDLLRRWIEQGAYDPREATAAANTKKSSALSVANARDHWSYRPVSDPAIPDVKRDSQADHVENAIDAFIQEKLREEEIPAAPRAGRGELLRRLSFDLLGLPPSEEQLNAFLSDDRPDAYDRVVDRLLASPRFGERMARHWMDVARYAESVTLRGLVLPQAWRYRDYLITAFREDRSMRDQIQEQIAGDLLTHDDPDRRQQQLIGTGFLALGNTNLEEQDKAQLEMDYIDEQLDVIGRVYMAQTIGCARCHDHKFDPIPTKDYYALAGIFKASQSLIHENVSRWLEKPLPADPKSDQAFVESEEKLAALIKEQTQLEKRMGVKSKTKEKVSIDPSSLSGIVVDDENAKKVGEWVESSTIKPYVGVGYIHDGNNSGIAKTLTFQPENLPEGSYQVRFAYTASANRSTKSIIRVFSADGEKAITINQQTEPPVDDLWYPLGTFRFEKDGQAFVMLSNEGGDGHVIADAVQFLPEDEAVQLALKEKQKNSKTATTDTAAKTSTEPEIKPDSEMQERLAKLKKQRTQLEKFISTRPKYLTLDEKLPASDLAIQIRGNVHNTGAVAPRGFLTCADFEQRQPFPPETSGRLELAKWLSDDRHPLTSRVYSNRVWNWFMGSGLVRTVDNFGTTGEAPLHPELVDHLAQEFIRHDWSSQNLVRYVLHSAAYQRTVDADERTIELDPENQHWSRSVRRRLDAESLRDSMLLISGELSIPALGGSTLREGLKEDYRYEHVPELRAVYQPILRNTLPELFDAFDFPNPSISTGQRGRSTVSTQALAMLNNTWIKDRAKSAAKRMINESKDGAALSKENWQQSVELIFWRCLGRKPSQNELYSAQTLIEQLQNDKVDEETIVARLFHGVFSSIDYRFLD